MKSLISIFFMLACSAQASDIARPGYEFRMRPEKNQQLVLPQIGFVNVKDRDANITGRSSTLSGTRIGVEYLKGLENWAVGTRVSYEEVGKKNEKFSGLNDLEVVAKSSTDYKNEEIHYGVTGYWSPDKKRYNGLSSNNFSGGMAVEPYVALVKKMESGKATFGVAYTKQFERKIVDGTTAPSMLGTVVGGDVTHFYAAYDHNYKDNVIGASANIYNQASESLQGTAVESDSVNIFKGEVYWMGRVNESTKFVPSIQYYEATGEGVTGLQGQVAYLKTY